MSTAARGDRPALTATALAKRYGRGTWALSGIDLEVPCGGITALVGPNAAGKSTLIKTWVGFERSTRGNVTVAGIDPWRDRQAAGAHLGYIPQTPALYDALSVDDHLELALALRPTFDRAYARARLDELGIPGGQRARTLSGGQQAQVALALALGTQAEILLLDEPLASLDPLPVIPPFWFVSIRGEVPEPGMSGRAYLSAMLLEIEPLTGLVIVVGRG